MELNGVQILDLFNHNEKGNPHPQYAMNKFETSASNAVNTYIKLFNYKTQLDPSLVTDVRNRYGKGMIFEAHVYTPKSGKGTNTLGTLAVMIIPNGTDLYARVSYTPLIASDNNFSVIEPFLAYVKTSNAETTEHDVNVYIKVKNTGSPITVIPIFFSESYYTTNKYKKLYDSDVNDYERITRLLKDFPTNSYISESQFTTDTTGYTLVRDQNYIQTVPSYVFSGSGTDVTLSIQNNIEIVKMNASAATNLSKVTMSDVYEGKKLRIIFWNSNTTLVHAGGNMHTTGIDNKFILKGSANVVTNSGYIVDFVYMNNKWLEVSRNF